MGLLDSNYWQTATQTAQSRVATPATPEPAPQAPTGTAPAAAPNTFAPGIPTPTQIGQAVAPYVPPVAAAPTVSLHKDWRSFFDTNAQSIVKNNQSSPAEQTAQYGDVIGSQAYYAKKATENPYATVGAHLGPYAAVGGAVGLLGGPVGAVGGALAGASIGANSFPEAETWDSMTSKGKAEYLANSGTKAGLNLIAGLPQQIASAAIRFGASAAQPWVELAKGKSFSQSSLAANPELNVPLLGKVPTYFQQYDQAIKAGNGPLAAWLSTIGTAAGDVSIVGSLGEAAAKALQPRATNITPLHEATVADKTGPQAAIDASKGIVTKEPAAASEGTGAKPVKQMVLKSDAGKTMGVANAPEGSTAEYYTLPPNTAKEFGGNTGNTFFKMTPASPDTVELSVVKVRSGLIPQTIDALTGKSKQTYQGDFGPEMKVQSQVVPLTQKVDTTEATMPGQTGAPKTSLITAADQGVQGLVPDIQAVLDRTDVIAPGGLHTELTEALDTINQHGEKTNPDVVASAREALQLANNKIEAADVTKSSRPPSIPDTATIGRENAPITRDQLSNLGKISDSNGLDPVLRDAVIKTVTGKDVMGEMTQTEYVKAAKALAMFNDSNRFVPKGAYLNPASQWLSPQRRWMRAQEEAGGAPVYSRAYVPLENAMNARNVARLTLRGEGREAFGDFVKPGSQDQRIAIGKYMQGDTAAIIDNPAFKPAERTAMIDAANNMRALFNKYGPQFDVPPEVFLDNYLPHVQNTGGVFSLYKEGASQPNGIDFFAKFKRTGNTGAPLIEDPLALWDIYTNAGTNSKFVSPVLDKIGQFGETLPDTLKGSLKAYVLEKMGYGGRIEQAMDEAVPAINRKLGINLPPDLARQVGNTILSTQYGALLSQPVTILRNMLQYPLLGYSRLGPDFAASAYKQALTKGGLQELADKGLLIHTDDPYGNMTANEGSVAGKAVSLYKGATQKVITPHSVADNIQRAVVYYQFKGQFQNALQLYNDGKITWPQFEGKIGMNNFSTVDQNIARQSIVGGDTEGAFNHLVRDVIDDTQFPYRKAAGPRLFNGFGGHVVGSFLSWPLEAAHTFGTWLKRGTQTGNFDPVIRYLAASSLINNTMQKQFGMDFTRSLFLGPVLTSSVMSPMVSLAVSSMQALMNSPWLGAAGGANNRQLFNQNASAVMQSLKSVGYPGALEAQNIAKFKNSIDGYQKDLGNNSIIDPKNPYPVYDTKGNLSYRTDFAGLFMGTLLNFPIDKKLSESKLNTEMNNVTEDRIQQKGEIMQLLQQEKYNDAASLMEKYKIMVTPQDMDKYYIPRTQRTWNALPPVVKAQFAPSVFPDAFAGQPGQ